MSIINDALKKAQKLKGKLAAGDNSKDEQSQPNSPDQTIDQNNSSASKSFNPRKLHLQKPVIIIVAVIIGLFLINKVIFRPKKVIYISKDDIVRLKEDQTPANSKSISVKPKTTRTRPGPSITTEPKPEVIRGEKITIKPSEMQITGIVTGSGEPFAIINDKIYREGDSLGTAKIAKISENKIIFDYDGRQMTFTTSQPTR